MQINWDKERRLFLKSDCANIKIFCEKRNLKYNATSRQKLAGIKKEIRQINDNLETEKQEIKKEIIKKTTKDIEVIAKKEIDRNNEHLEVYDLALAVVKDYLKNKKYNDFVIKSKSVDQDGSFIEGYSEVKLNAVNTKSFSEIVKSLEVTQKGHRLAEGLDKDNYENIEAPEINIIEGLDRGKI